MMRAVLLFLAMMACGGLGDAEVSDGVAPSAIVDSGSAAAPPPAPLQAAYTACVTDASCGAGEACTTVPGYATPYCAPACDPDASAEAQAQTCGVVEGIDAFCTPSGRCARTCGEPDTCPDDLACQRTDTMGRVCAGEEMGSAGPYGTCTHPLEAGPDCPTETDCFGGSLLGIENGICLPWCDSGDCPEAPDELEGVTPLCFDTTEYGFEHPLCVLLCVPSAAVCPSGQECLDYGGFGICAPDGLTL